MISNIECLSRQYYGKFLVNDQWILNFFRQYFH